MTAEALQLILDLQKKVEKYERFHFDLIFMLGKKNTKIVVPPLEDDLLSIIYQDTKKLIEGKNEND